MAGAATIHGDKEWLLGTCEEKGLVKNGMPFPVDKVTLIYIPNDHWLYLNYDLLEIKEKGLMEL